MENKENSKFFKISESLLTTVLNVIASGRFDMSFLQINDVIMSLQKLEEIKEEQIEKSANK